MTTFCHSSVDHEATSVIPPLHPEGWVKTVVRTNGFQVAVVLGTNVVCGVEVDEVELDDELDDEDGIEAVDNAELVGVTPEVMTPMVSS